MFNTLRKHSKIIIIIVIVAMAVTGILLGINSYLFNGSTSANAPSPYIAKVNKTSINQQDYLSILQNRAAQASQLKSSQIIPFKFNILNSMIEREVILQKADEMGIKPKTTDQDVQETINKILEANKITKEDLVNNLEGQGYSFKQLEKDIKTNLEINDTIQQTIERTYSNVKVTEEDIIRSYEKIHPVVIAINFKDDQEAAEKRIKEALAAIKSGDAFADVTSKYSDLKLKDGDFGELGHESRSLPSEVIEKAFSLDKGEISNVITGSKAYYLVKVLDKKIASGKDYEEAKPVLKEKILKEEQNEVFKNWLKNTKAEAKITIFDSSLSGYRYLLNNNFKQAIKELEKAVDINPNPSIYVYLSEAYQGNGEKDKAIANYEVAIEQYPEDWELYFNYGSYYVRLDESEKAITQYDKAAEFAGDDFIAHYQLAMAYYSLEANEKADIEMNVLKELQLKMQEEQAQQDDSSSSNNSPAETDSTSTSTENNEK